MGNGYNNRNPRERDWRDGRDARRRDEDGRGRNLKSYGSRGLGDARNGDPSLGSAQVYGSKAISRHDNRLADRKVDEANNVIVPDPSSESTPVLTAEEEDKRIEERRKRRAELLAKYSNQNSTAPSSTTTPNSQQAIMPVTAVLEASKDENRASYDPNADSVSRSPFSDAFRSAKPSPEIVMQDAHLIDPIPTFEESQQASAREMSVESQISLADNVSTPGSEEGIEISTPQSPGTPTFASQMQSPHEQAFNSIEELAGHRRFDNVEGEEQTAAADYDEMMGQDDDRMKRIDMKSQGGTKIEAQQIVDDDDDFDMFADDEEIDKKLAAKPVIDTKIKAPKQLGVPGPIDDFDNSEGYLKYKIHTTLDDDRYEIIEELGKGMFANVFRARDTSQPNKLVAIKIIRNNDAMRVSGASEIRILEKLNEEDPHNKKHIVRFFGHFDYKQHLCMIFEDLGPNLRDILKRHGRDVGLNMPPLKQWSYQLFLGLAHLKKCMIVHADLKPDNILVTKDLKSVKICDLGTAADFRDNLDTTAYLASRFYRAPEVILGMKYDYGIDMWAIGCTLFELWTGKILFTGRNNNQMLKAIMEVKGNFSMKYLKKGEFSGKHFEDNGDFVSVDIDPKTQQWVTRKIKVIKPARGRDIKSRMKQVGDPKNFAEKKDVELLADLVEHCLTPSPDRRIKPEEALRSPFFLGEQKKKRVVPTPVFKPNIVAFGGAASRVQPKKKKPAVINSPKEQSHVTSLTPEPSPALVSTPVQHQAPVPVKGFKKTGFTKTGFTKMGSTNSNS
jgi:serine/threonine protein kinase